MISAVIQPRLAPGLNRIAKWLAKIGISPNLLSFSSLVINTGAAFLFSQGRFLAAGLLMVPGGCLDFLDGSLARVTGRDKGLGSLLDAVLDRYSDLVILAGIAFFYASQGRPGILLLVLVTMMGFMIVPYARARAEFLIPSCRVGIMGRPERWFLLALGAVVDQLPIFLAILALLTHFTVAQRIYFTWRQLLNQEGKLDG
ncbi:MAG: CDP-alcohol phosphatidyltransferase family protein [Thermodesulfobacteriota bacterium]